MAKKLANTISILLLLGLFIFPAMSLSRFCDDLVSHAEEAVSAVKQEDWQRGVEHLHSMNLVFDKKKNILHLFLHHELVEGLEAAIRGGLQLMYVEDSGQAVMELETIITRAKYLKSIEVFSVPSLL
ncbi:MAG: hypothetical protein BWY62_01254 [Firmicutes bacterium ADurb.Bin356]|nr:MAG: hypothetical protein BWY62_01254 [Firmicutes bacterium ADurb.Bin356]